MFRHINQLPHCPVRIQNFNLAGNGAHPRQRPVVDFLLLEIHAELDQITRAKFDLPHLPDIDEIRSSLRKNPLAVSQYQLLAVYGFNARYFAGIADAFHVPDEADGHARLEVRSVLQPCFRFVPRTEHFRFTSCPSDYLYFLQFGAHRSRQLIALVMRRRNQNRTVQILPLFCVCHILLGSFIQIVLFPIMDKVLFVKPFERLFKLPHRTLENSTAILLIPLTVNLR